MNIDITNLLKKFREYEREYMGDQSDALEWRKDFLEFVLWLAETGSKTQLTSDDVPACQFLFCRASGSN